MAAPHVAGAAALWRAGHPSATPAHARDRGTRVVIAMTLGAAILACLDARSMAPELRRCG